MIRKFKKKPVVIEAVQWTGENINEIYKFLRGSSFEISKFQFSLTINTLEGNMRADANDWIIKGVNGEFYPCKPDIFEKTYEEVSE